MNEIYKDSNVIKSFRTNVFRKIREYEIKNNGEKPEYIALNQCAMNIAMMLGDTVFYEDFSYSLFGIKVVRFFEDFNGEEFPKIWVLEKSDYYVEDFSRDRNCFIGVDWSRKNEFS